MQTVKARLSAKYIYIRSDDDFILHFTNGSVLPFHRGFYALLASDLQKYNTNNEFDIISENDSASIWWLSTDTLIMSVTDINTDYLEVLTNYANLASNYDSFKIQQNNDIKALLMSLQNSLSTFLNTYVEANSIVDYGFQQGIINGSNATIYIAKPSSVNKYLFNAKVSLDLNFSSNADWTNRVASSINVLYYASLSNSYFTLEYTNGEYYISSVAQLVNFLLYDNSNHLLSGYSISNVSSSSNIQIEGTVRKKYNVVNGVEELVQLINCSYSVDDLLECDTFSNGFVIPSNTEQLTAVTQKSSQVEVPLTGVVHLDITFDVEKDE